VAPLPSDQSGRVVGITDFARWTPPRDNHQQQAVAPAVQFDHVSLAFDDTVVLEDVSFTVPHGRMTILIGPSGSGKSVILKLALGLLRPDGGVIRVNGVRIDTLSEAELIAVRDEIGMLFQEGALFDSLTVEQNVGYKLHDAGEMSEAEVRSRVREVLGSAAGRLLPGAARRRPGRPDDSHRPGAAPANRRRPVPAAPRWPDPVRRRRRDTPPVG
jgi:ABC-type multidrug transport system fused ATPase/permease subunit